MERDDIDTDKLVRKYLNGCDIDALSKFYDCSKSTIVYRLKKAGVYATVKNLTLKSPEHER